MAVLEPQQQRSIATQQRVLDAVVAELLENGYNSVTTVRIAARARVTRGAQQHHFPNREALVAEAVRHMARRHATELEQEISRLPEGRRRVADALDLVYAQYSGRRFAAMFELSLAARNEPFLRDIVDEEEQQTGRTVYDIGRAVFGAEALNSSDFATRWAVALSTIRGLAVLRMLGHSEASLTRQWALTRDHLIRSLRQH